MSTTIFWDFDGTLCYCHHLWSSSMHEALLAVDPLSPVTLHDIRRCNRQGGFPWDTPDDDHTAFIGEAWWDFLHEHFMNSYLSCGAALDTATQAAGRVRGILTDPKRYFLYDDTKTALQIAKENGCCNVVLSNNYPELDTIMDALGLLPYFDGLIISGLEGYDKPRKELFDIAKSRCPAERYVMVGDNPFADILGGKQAGCTTVLVHKPSRADTDYCADTLMDAVNWIL